MSSKTDISGRIKHKVIVVDDHGHDIKRVKVVGHGFKWWCETCGTYTEKGGVVYKQVGGKK